MDLVASADSTTAATSSAFSAVRNIADIVSFPSWDISPSPDRRSELNASFAAPITFFKFVALSGLLNTASIFSLFFAPIS